MAVRLLHIAFLALALLALGSQGKLLNDEDEVVIEETVHDEAADEVNPLMKIGMTFGSELLEVTLDSSFPFVDLVAWAANMTEDEFQTFSHRFQSFVSRTNEILNAVKVAIEVMDPKKVHQHGPLAEGLNRLLLRRGPAKNHTELKIKREEKRQERLKAKQTPEEKQQEAITRASLKKGVWQLVQKIAPLVYMPNATQPIVYDGITKLVPPIMKWRRYGDSNQRALVDELTEVFGNAVKEFSEVPGLESPRDIKKAVKSIDGLVNEKYNQVAEVFQKHEWPRAAGFINMSTPLLRLMRNMEPLRQGGRFNFTSMARLLDKVTEVPNIEMLRELQTDPKSLPLTKENLRVIARLLEASATRHEPAKKLLLELGLKCDDSQVPMIVDAIRVLDDVTSTPLNTTQIFADGVAIMDSMTDEQVKQNTLAFVNFAKEMAKVQPSNAHQTVPVLMAQYLNAVKILGPEALQQGVSTMRWMLLGACSIDEIASKKSFCKDYRGSTGLNLFRKRPTEAKLQESIRRKLRGTLKASDAAAFIQRTVSVEGRPFPTDKIVDWASNKWPDTMKGMKSSIHTVKVAQWMLNNQRLFRSVAHGIDNIAHGRTAPSKAEVRAQKEQNRANRTKSISGPPKQTPEERQREVVTRKQYKASLDSLLAKGKLPGVVRMPIEAMLVPDIMNLRRRTGHQGRMLIDELANLSSNVSLRADSLKQKGSELMQAFSKAGYEAVPRTVDSILTKTSGGRKLIGDLKAAAASGNAELSADTVARLLHDAADLMPGDNFRSKFMAKLIGLLNSTTTGRPASASMTEVAAQIQSADPAAAEVLRDVSAVMAIVARIAGNTSLKSLARIEETVQASTVNDLTHRMADMAMHMGNWSALTLSDRDRSLFKHGGWLMHKAADFKKGDEAEVFQHFAKSGASSIFQEHPNMAEGVASLLESALTLVCSLHGVDGELLACKELNLQGMEPGAPSQPHEE